MITLIVTLEKVKGRMFYLQRTDSWKKGGWQPAGKVTRDTTDLL
jgi:hypothetical protein